MAEETKIMEKQVPENKNGGSEPSLSQQNNAVTPEMMNELMAKFEEVQNKNRSLNSMNIMNSNRGKENNIKIVQELLGKMDAMGVDLSDQNSINEFLASLEQQDPDLRELFEYAFNNLMGGLDKNIA